MDLFGTGLRHLFGGARRGNAALAALGAALLALGWVRRTAGPRRRLIYQRTLKRGEAVRIGVVDPGRPGSGEGDTAPQRTR